jgi:hypothetical protein
MNNNVNTYFREAYDKIPEAYRERYGILLIEAYENTSFIPVLSIEIKHARISIIPNGKEISVSEANDRLTIKAEGAAEIWLHKHYTMLSVTI